MVKLDYLSPFETYKTRPPVIMPENKDNRKKFSAYIVWAPSIEESLKFVADNKVLSFRYLSNYFVEKRWEYMLRGQGKRIEKLNDGGEISDLLNAYHRGNLQGVSGVTSYLPTLKIRPLKDLNVLVETNHVTEAILFNPKDTRLTCMRVDELLKEYQRLYKSVWGPDNYLGNYSSVTTVIPMNLWFKSDDYMSPTNIMKRNSKNPMGILLNSISDPTVLMSLGTIVLMDGNVITVLDANRIPENSKPDFILKEIQRFMMKARIQRDGLADDTDPDTGAIVDANTSSLSKAEAETSATIKVEKTLEKAKIDPDEISKDKKEQLATIISKDDAVDLGTGDLKIKSAEDVDVILSAKMEGRSVESFKRNQLLKEKFRELHVGAVPIETILASEEKYDIPDVTVGSNVIFDSMRKITSHNFEKAYNENVAQYDLVNILMHFSKVKPALYINKDIAVEDISDDINRIYRYTVEFEDENRKRHRFSFKLPKMYQDKYLYLNGQKFNIIHQKMPMPVTKTAPDRCQAVTNYNKVFSYRYGSNLSPRITKIKKVFSSPDCPRAVKAITGDGTLLNKNYLTTIEYDELASNITRLHMGKTQNDYVTLYFIVEDSFAVVPKNAKPNEIKSLVENDGKTNEMRVADGTLIPLGARKCNKVDTYYFLSGTSNHVYDQTGKDYGELSDFIIDTLYSIEPAATKLFDDTSAGTKFVYSRCKIMAQDVPMILVLGASDPGGLVSVLEKAKIKFEFITERPTVDKNQTGVIRFADGWLTFERYPYENSLLLNGLGVFPSTEFNFSDMGVRDTYIEIFDLMFNRRNLIDGIENFYYMMIDPITKDILERLDMPLDFTKLMLFCNGTLADNTFQIDSNYANSRLRSNEIVYALLYRELASAWAAFKDGRAEKFSIPEDIIIKNLLMSNIVDSHSKLNVTLELENDRQVKLKGPSGMNEDRSFTLEKRAYHPSMRGIISMNSTPSGEVGINRHMSLNANITDVRGFVKINKASYDGTELASPGELLQTFGPESADIERVAMSISQSKHLVPVASQCSSIVTYDMERVVPYLSNDFTFLAKKNGTVIDISEGLMIIKYEDGTIDDVDLSEHPDKNTDGGFYIIGKFDTDLKVGDKVTENQIVAYDKKYINDKDMFGDPCANIGTMARVSLEANGGLYEDSTYITDDLAHRIATKITVEKRVILSKFANIKYLAKIGQHVKANDPILTFDDTEDEFSSNLLAAMAAEVGDEEEVIATTAPVVTKVTGTIKDIEIRYTVPLEDMTPSMRNVVDEYVKKTSKRERVLAKYKDPRDANTLVRTSKISVPDSMGKVNGVSIGEGMFITFFIEYDDVAGVGDKVT